MDSSILEKRIIVIDDDASFREIFEMYFTLLGFRNVHIYPSAKTFLSNEEDSIYEIDFLITDMSMGAMSGARLTRYLREELKAEFPIAIITAHTNFKEEPEYIQFLQIKPFTVEDLQELLNSAFKFGGEDLNENGEARIT